MGGEEGRVYRNICKGHMDKTKRGWDQWWEVGIAGMAGNGGRKMEKLYLNNNKKIIK